MNKIIPNATRVVNPNDEFFYENIRRNVHEIDPARLELCIRAALKILRDDPNVDITVSKNQGGG